jgi:hypothetical protein
MADCSATARLREDGFRHADPVASRNGRRTKTQRQGVPGNEPGSDQFPDPVPSGLSAIQQYFFQLVRQ